MGEKTELDRTFEVTLSYAKFYEKYHISSLRTLIKEQGTVRPSLSKLLGVVTISRRSAAGGRTDTVHVHARRDSSRANTVTRCTT